MIRDKIAATENEILSIRSQLSKLSVMQPPTPVFHLKETGSSKSSFDSSTYTVVEARCASSSKNAKFKKESISSSNYASSIGSVFDLLKSGKNHSFDDVATNTKIASTLRNASESVLGSVSVPVDKVVSTSSPDMSNYYIPSDMNVAVNKESFDNVVKEMGKEQPKFLQNLINELKNKYICLLQ
jgi:hypothetical protein